MSEAGAMKRTCTFLERFPAKWMPVRVKKTRKNNESEPRSDSIGSEKALAPRRHKGSLLADRRGAVAFEMLIVFAFILIFLLLPAADLAVAGFQFISAWEALRTFGEYVQYNQPPDPTSPSTWWTGLNKTVGVHTMSLVNVICGEASHACATGNLASPKYYSYTTTVTLTPMVLNSVLCKSKNTNPCSFTLSYSERFQ
jgi:hypothetical protein